MATKAKEPTLASVLERWVPPNDPKPLEPQSEEVYPAIEGYFKVISKRASRENRSVGIEVTDYLLEVLTRIRTQMNTDNHQNWKAVSGWIWKQRLKNLIKNSKYALDQDMARAFEIKIKALRFARVMLWQYRPLPDKEEADEIR